MDIEKAFEEFIEKEWHDGHEPQGIDDQYVEEMEDEEVEEARAYKNKQDDDEKKKKRPFAFGGKKDKTRHGAGGYGKGSEEVEEKKSHTGYELYHKDFSSAMQHAYAHAKKKGHVIDPKEIDDKVATGPKKPSSGKTNRYSLKAGRKKVEIQVANLDNKRYELNMYIEGVDLDEAKSKLPPHLAKFFDKDGNLKKDAAARVAKGREKINWKDVTPKGYGPKEEVEEDYDKNQLLRVQHDERLIAEAGDICSLDKSDLRSKSMQKVWDKKCSPEKHKKSIFGKISKGLDLYNQNSIGEQKMEKLVDTVRKVLMGEGEGDQAEYQKKRKAVAKKFGVESCSALKDEKEKKACYKALDDAHVADHEEQVELEKMKKEGVGELSDKELKIKMKDASTQKETEAACGEMGKRRLKMEKKKVTEKTISKLFSHVRKLMSK